MPIKFFSDLLNLPSTIDKYSALNAAEQYFQQKLQLYPIIGAELEFYLSPNLVAEHIAQLTNYVLKPERGAHQYEVDILPQVTILQTARKIDAARGAIIKAATDLGGQAQFNSKPFINDFGSSMHIHLNFANFTDVEAVAPLLCCQLANYIHCFLPQATDWQRLEAKFMAPTHISWGGNNRSTLIRIPDALPKRLEHRLAAAAADPVMVILAILATIATQWPARHQCHLPKIYGNAFDPQYNLPSLLALQKTLL